MPRKPISNTPATSLEAFTAAGFHCGCAHRLRSGRWSVAVTVETEAEARDRCLLCQRWRCDGPLQRCAGCQAEYERGAAGMGERHEQTLFRGEK